MDTPRVPRISVFEGINGTYYATEGFEGPYLIRPNNLVFAVSANEVPPGSGMSLKDFARQQAEKRNIRRVDNLD